MIKNNTYKLVDSVLVIIVVSNIFIETHHFGILQNIGK